MNNTHDNTPRPITDKEWKEKLSPEAYRVLREKGTEAPFSGKLLHSDEDGIYRCAACSNPLFESDAKFDSGTGWPSFDDALPGSVRLIPDVEGGVERTEVVCAKCGSHLGHLFNDGPTPTGLRYCMNSVCLDLDPRHAIKKVVDWKYKNTAALVLSIILLLMLADTEMARVLINHIGSYGYAGAVVTGVFFVSTFTVAPASLVLFHLANEFNPVYVALFSGAGAVVGDLIIFHFLKDGVFDELRPLFSRFRGSYLSKLIHTQYFVWLVPVMGALIVASPFPDEVGIALMGLSKITTWQFILLAFVLNSAGIFAIITLAAII